MGGGRILRGAGFVGKELTKHYAGEGLKFTMKNPDQAMKNVAGAYNAAGETFQLAKAGVSKVLGEMVGDGAGAGAAAASTVTSAASSATNTGDDGVDLIRIAGYVALSAAIGYGLYHGAKWWLATPEEQEAKEVIDKIADRSSPESRQQTMMAQQELAKIKDPKVRAKLSQKLMEGYSHEVSKMGQPRRVNKFQ